MTSITCKPTLGNVAGIALALLENGTPEGKKEGRLIVTEMGQALEACTDGEDFCGKTLTVERQPGPPEPAYRVRVCAWGGGMPLLTIPCETRSGANYLTRHLAGMFADISDGLFDEYKRPIQAFGNSCIRAFGVRGKNAPNWKYDILAERV